ncbi:hypothetical protein V3C99_011501 [Haemonchus contortus]|uniref:Uncharacterized protein n=2 Tax=Haemonchus TaxID=6288 RepID=A0A0N4WFN0_HAEPC|nr:unnamed protein product [Haemonchus placei]
MRSMILLLLFVLVLLIDAKPHLLDNTVRVIRVKRWEWYRPRWSGTMGYRPLHLRPIRERSWQDYRIQLYG